MKLTKTRHRETVEVASHTSAITSEVHYGFVYIDEPIFGRADTNDDGDFADSEEQFYYTTNNLYNVVALLDTSGNIIERYEYKPYGEVTVYVDDGGDSDWFDGDETTGSLTGNYYTFTGRRYDPESDLCYFRARMYSPGLGRFISRDPLDIPLLDDESIDSLETIQRIASLWYSARAQSTAGVQRVPIRNKVSFLLSKSLQPSETRHFLFAIVPDAHNSYAYVLSNPSSSTDPAGFGLICKCSPPPPWSMLARPRCSFGAKATFPSPGWCISPVWLPCPCTPPTCTWTATYKCLYAKDAKGRVYSYWQQTGTPSATRCLP